MCINPYHYERVQAAVLPPILVPLRNESVPGFSLLPPQQIDQVTHIRMPGNVVAPTNRFSNGSCSPAPSSPTVSSSSCGYQQQYQQPYQQEQYPQMQNQSQQMNQPTDQSQIQQNNQMHVAQQQNDVVAVSYVEPEIWAEIAYYELNCRVGETFKCTSAPITIDGFTNPSNINSNRFCLGQLSNINRNSTVSKVHLTPMTLNDHHIKKSYYINVIFFFYFC